MISRFTSIYNRAEHFFQTGIGKKVVTAGKYLIQAAIIVVLLYQIISIGLQNILSELPVQPLFYLIFLIIYFALPVTEYFTYNISWKIGFWKSQEIFLKKRVYNKTVLGYSGEVQLFFWLQKHLGVAKKEAFEVVRDNNTLSTLASTGVAVGLLSIFLLTGRLSIFDWIEYDPLIVAPIAAAALIVGIIIFRKFREYLFSMNRKQALTIFSLHSGRMLMLTIFQVLQWYVVMPEVDFQIWFTIVAIQLILSRIPFLPNKDLIFIGTSLEFGQHVDISTAGLAGLLLVNHILDKVMNVLVFFYLSLRERRNDINSEIR